MKTFMRQYHRHRNAKCGIFEAIKEAWLDFIFILKIKAIARMKYE